MRRHLFPLLTLLAASCHHPHAAAISPEDPISDREYDLYAAALHTVSAVYDLDSTVPYVCPRTKLVLAGFVSICDPMSELKQPVALAAFLTVNRIAFAVSAEELRRRGLDLRGPAPKDGARSCPTGPATVSLSRAAFNQDSTMALLSVGIVVGDGGGPGGQCGYAAASLSVYEWTAESGWKESFQYYHSMS